MVLIGRGNCFRVLRKQADAPDPCRWILATAETPSAGWNKTRNEAKVWLLRVHIETRRDTYLYMHQRAFFTQYIWRHGYSSEWRIGTEDLCVSSLTTKTHDDTPFFVSPTRGPVYKLRNLGDIYAHRYIDLIALFPSYCGGHPYKGHGPPTVSRRRLTLSFHIWRRS